MIESLMVELQRLSDEQKWPPVRRITIKVGAMRQVIPEAMLFAFEVASKDSFLEGAELELVETPIMARCRRCGFQWGGEEGLVCPDCGSANVGLLSGMELEIDSVEVEELNVKEN